MGPPGLSVLSLGLKVKGQGGRKCQVSAKGQRCLEMSTGLKVRAVDSGLALPLTCCLTLGSSLPLPEIQFPHQHNDEVGLQISIVSHILKKV